MFVFKNFIIVFFLGLMGLTACNSEPRSKEPSQTDQKEMSELDKLRDKVIGIHDEVMPKMGNLERAARDLAELVAGEGMDPEAVSKINAQIQALEDANESMMEWMRNYSPPGLDVSDTDKMAYYESQLVKVNKVKSNMLGALESAENMLEELKGE